MPVARSFFLADGTSHKFWTIEVDGVTVRTRFGRIGSKGVADTRENYARLRPRIEERYREFLASP